MSTAEAGGSLPAAPTASLAAEQTVYIDRLRETSKWVMGAFAAVGALLLTGAQVLVIALGAKLSNWLFLGVAGFLLAMIGIGIAIFAASKVMNARAPKTPWPQSTSIPAGSKQNNRPLEQSPESTAKAERDSLRFFPYDTEVALRDAFESERKKYLLFLGHANDAAELSLSKAESYAARLNDWRRVLAVRTVQQTFEAAMKMIGVGVGLVTLGTVIFVGGMLLATHLPTKPILLSGPVAGTLTIVNLKGAKIQPLLPCTGKAKDGTRSLPVVVLEMRIPKGESSGYESDVAPTPQVSATCPVKKYTIPSSEATVSVPVE